MAKKIMSSGADLSRNKDLAGQTVSKGGFNITYDKNGYATSASNYNHSTVKGTDRGVAAPSADAVLSGGNRSSSGGSSTDRSYLNDKELSHLTTLQQRWQEASAAGDQDAMKRAHDEAESIRARYGYSGGTDGGGYSQLPVKQWDPDGGSSSGGGISYRSGSSGGSVGAGGSFSYGNAPSYINRYQSQIDELTAQILGREAFSYDPEKDPTYQQYKESYTRSGQRAMQDTLGQVSARTGGLASSYAGSAAQQTYDNYMSALADKIPELRQLAYSMYQDEGNTMRANLNMLAALEQGEYGKYADQLAQFNTDRSFNYGVYRDNVGDRRYDNEWNYQVGRDQIADSRYNDETAYKRSQYSSETEYSRALERAQMLASIGDFSGYKALGYSDQEIANLTNAYNAAQLLAQQQSTRRSGGSSGSRGSGSGTSQNTGIVDTMLSFGNDNQAYEYLIGLGYSNSKTDTLWNMYQSSKNGGGVEIGDSRVPTGGFSGLGGFTGNGTIAGGALAGALNQLLGGGNAGNGAPNFSSVKQNLNYILSNGMDNQDRQRALGYMDSVWGELSDTQRSEIQALLRTYGLAYNP